MPNNDLISRKALIEQIEEDAKHMMFTSHHSRMLHDDMVEFAINAIECAPAVDAEPVRHRKWKHIKKHLWHKDENGEIDMYYLDFGFHNGPGCEICGECICESCEPDWAEKECRIGYYVCSECEQPTKTGESNYCPNCGAKLENPK